jgi:hypothetical protein
MGDTNVLRSVEREGFLFLEWVCRICVSRGF